MLTTSFPTPPAQYSRDDESQFRAALARALGSHYHPASDIQPGTLQAGDYGLFGKLLITEDSAADAILQSFQNGDTQPRFELSASGKMQWGPGGATVLDTNLYRSAASILQTDDSLVIGGSVLRPDVDLGSDLGSGSKRWGTVYADTLAAGTITGTWDGSEIPASMIVDGTARQVLQTNAAGNDTEWTSSLDLPGTLDVTGAVVFDSTLNVAGAITGNLTGNVTGALTGNASTATALQTARAINGVSFDGTAAITVTAAAGTLTGTTLASGVVTSSLTAVGTIATGVWNATAIDWAKVSKTGSSLADLVTRSAGDLSSGNFAYARLPTGNGSWDTGAGTTLTVTRDLTVTGTLTATLTGAAAAGSLTGTTLAANVVASSLTSVGTLTGLQVQGAYVTDKGQIYAKGLSDHGYIVADTDTPTTKEAGFRVNQSGSIVWRFGLNANSTDFVWVTGADTPLRITTAGAATITGTLNVSGGVTAALTGNASTATALQNARTIGGTSFNGTANITVATATGGFTVSGGALALGANDLTMTGSLGATGARLTKGWFTDLQVTNAIAGSVTGSAATWTTARNLAGNSVDGSGNVAFANKFIVQGTADAGLSAAQFLGALGTGILKNTTTTGVLSIAVAGDFPTLNQNTTGSAATLTTARTIGGTSFDGSANITVATATGGFTVSGGALALGANDLTMTGSLGATGARLTKGWFTDLQVTNAIAGSVTGNAATATALETARTIGGTSFNGTANITVATATGGFTVSGGALALGANDLTMTGSLGATGARLTKGWFTDLQVTNAITGSVTGNAATATALETARTIGGVSFNGTANITVVSATGGFAVSGGHLTVDAGATSVMRFGSDSGFLTYNAFSLNNDVTDAGLIGLIGGGDANLYVQAKAAGSVIIRSNGNTTAATFDSNQRLKLVGGLALSNSTAPSHGIQFGTSAPGTLADGQIWYDGTNLKARLAGATKTITVA